MISSRDQAHVRAALYAAQKHFFIKKSDYTHFYYLDTHILHNQVTLLTHEELGQYDFHNSIIMNAPVRSPVLEAFLTSHHYAFTFDYTIGYSVR